MSLYDEGQFCALDADVLAENMPGDTHIEFGINHNLDVLEERHCEAVSVPHPCNAITRTSYLSERAYASVEWLCIHVTPFIVHPTLNSLKVYMPARVTCESAEVDRERDPLVKVKIELLNVAVDEFVIEEQTEFDVVEMDLAVNAPPVKVTTLLRIWVRSVRTQTHEIYDPELNRIDQLVYRAASMPEFLQFDSSISPQQFGLFGNETPPGPNDDDWSIQAVGPRNKPPVDTLVHADSSFDASYGALILADYNEPEASLRYDLSYLQHRGFFVEGTHTPLGFDDRAMRDSIPSRGDIAATHAARTRRLIDRERPVCLGWQGNRLAANEQWEAQERAQRWPTGALVAPFEELVRLPLSVMDAEPLVDLHLAVVAYVPLTNLAVSDDKLESLQAFGAPGTASLTVRLGQFSAGSLGTVDQFDINIPVFAYPTDRTGRWPLLTQLMWRDTSVADQDAYTLKEGCLYERDFELVHFSRTTFDASSVDESESERPLAVEILTKTFSFDPDIEDDFVNFDNTQVKICVVGASIYTSQLVL